MEPARVVSANDHGEGVFKAKRIGNCDVVSRSVEPAHGIENGLWISIDRLLEDGSEGGSGVFNVGVDAS